MTGSLLNNCSKNSSVKLSIGYDLLNIIEELNRKNVSFVSLKENVDTSTPQGKLMLTIFAGLAQFERECILQRQAEGIAIAKAEGKYRGR